MKRLKFGHLNSVALIATGVILGRAAQADTLITFNGLGGDVIPTAYGSFASSSSTGITVTGSGTPDIGLNWSVNTPVSGNLSDPVQFSYRNYGGGSGLWAPG